MPSRKKCGCQVIGEWNSDSNKHPCTAATSIPVPRIPWFNTLFLHILEIIHLFQCNIAFYFEDIAKTKKRLVKSFVALFYKAKHISCIDKHLFLLPTAMDSIFLKIKKKK